MFFSTIAYQTNNSIGLATALWSAFNIKLYLEAPNELSLFANRKISHVLKDGFNTTFQPTVGISRKRLLNFLQPVIRSFIKG